MGPDDETAEPRQPATELPPPPPGEATGPAAPPPAAAVEPGQAPFGGTTPPPDAWVGAPARPRRSALKLGLIIGAATLVVGGIAAGAVAFVALRGTSDVIAQRLPPDTAVYVTGYLDPGAGQKVNLLRLAGKFPQLHTDQLSSTVDQTLDKALADIGLTSKDVRPWVGSQVAIAVRIKGGAFPFGLLIVSRDDAAAGRALDKVRAASGSSDIGWTKRSHAGVDVWVGSSDGQPIVLALDQGLVVVADDEGFVDDVIDVTGGDPSLADSSTYRAALNGVPSDRLILAYVDPKPLVAKLESSISNVPGLGTLPQLSGSMRELDALTGVTATVVAEPNGMALSIDASYDRSKLPAGSAGAAAHRSEVLSFTPPGAYAVVAGGWLKQSVSSGLAQAATDPTFAEIDQALGISNVAKHLTGDIGLEAEPVAGAAIPGAAVLIGTDDASAMQTFLDAVATQAGPSLGSLGATGPWKHTAHGNVDIAYLSVPSVPGLEPAYAVSQGMALVATSPEEIGRLLDAKASGKDIGTDPTFAAAAGDEASAGGTLVYVNVEAALAAARQMLPTDAVEPVATDLGPVHAVALTSRIDADRARVRLFVLVP